MASSASHPTPPWQGVHHLALATRDLDAAVQFYTEVLGTTVLLKPPARPGSPRHLFVDAGGAALHLWEVADAEIFAQPIEPGPPRFVPGALQHLALRLPDEAMRRGLQDCLRAHGVKVTDIYTQGPVRLCFFSGPEGLALEAAYWTEPVSAGRPASRA